MDSQTLIGILAIATLGAVVAFALVSKKHVEDVKNDDDKGGSSLS